LFSGIGGFDLALETTGNQIVGACEIDEYARLVYKKHFPDVPMWEDAIKIKPEELPDFELLCAGFPCQAFSIAGKRLGFEESRGTLFFEIARIARQKRPKFLFLENVKGLLSHANGKTFANILATLDELGYDVEWQVLNSKYFVPQNRERIFIIGHLRGEGTTKIFPIKEDGGLPTQEQEPTVVRTITGGGHSGGLHSQMTLIVNDRGNLRKIKISSNLDANYWKGVDQHGARTMILLSHTKGNIKQRIQNEDEFWTVDTSGGKQGLIVLHNDKHSTNRLYDPKGISRTLRASAGGKGSKTGLYKTVEGIRRLTPLECERLQGFPDEWTEGVSDTQRYKQLGNAVTVPVVEFIARRFEN
jgi:DNA (cytosine-5)-methyltransferase 1